MSSKTPRMPGEVNATLSPKVLILDAFREGFDLNNPHNQPRISYFDFKAKRATKVTILTNSMEIWDSICKKNLPQLTTYARELGEQCGVVLSHFQDIRILHIYFGIIDNFRNNSPCKDPLSGNWMGWKAYVAGHPELDSVAAQFCWAQTIKGGKK
jgi:hypothetical protein